MLYSNFETRIYGYYVLYIYCINCIFYICTCICCVMSRYMYICIYFVISLQKNINLDDCHRYISRKCTKNLFCHFKNVSLKAQSYMHMNKLFLHFWKYDYPEGKRLYLSAIKVANLKPDFAKVRQMRLGNVQGQLKTLNKGVYS